MVGFLSLYDTKHMSHISIFHIWDNEEKKKKSLYMQTANTYFKFFWLDKKKKV